jgi:hypothetical protein
MMLKDMDAEAGTASSTKFCAGHRKENQSCDSNGVLKLQLAFAASTNRVSIHEKRFLKLGLPSYL